MSRIAVVFGSKSDLKFWEESKKYLDYFGEEADEIILSAHRTPNELAEFARSARTKGYSVLIGVAGMAAHLPGVIAAHTRLPGIGVPLPSLPFKGMDSFFSILQMPSGVPVATMSVGNAGAKNAAILAAQILALSDDKLRKRLKSLRVKGFKGRKM